MLESSVASRSLRNPASHASRPRDGRREGSKEGTRKEAARGGIIKVAGFPRSGCNVRVYVAEAKTMRHEAR